MEYYKSLVEALTGMAEVTRPLPGEETKQSKVQHGICDLMEDAAAAIDELIRKLEGTDESEERKHSEFA